jgi:hypothetical protein
MILLENRCVLSSKSRGIVRGDIGAMMSLLSIGLGSDCAASESGTRSEDVHLLTPAIYKTKPKSAQVGKRRTPILVKYENRGQVVPYKRHCTICGQSDAEHQNPFVCRLVLSANTQLARTFSISA